MVAKEGERQVGGGDACELKGRAALNHLCARARISNGRLVDGPLHKMLLAATVSKVLYPPLSRI
jgi:hypothetical protein